MKLFGKYTSIEGYLHRFTILLIGKLHIRLHSIKSSDSTELYHNHPFNFVSLLLTGGYEEHIIKGTGTVKKHYKAPCLIFRSHATLHRLHSVDANTKTLFIAYGKYKWRCQPIKDDPELDGIFVRRVRGVYLLCKRVNTVWYIGHRGYEDSINEVRHSIFQAEETP